jgi:hypothetical protein
MFNIVYHYRIQNYKNDEIPLKIYDDTKIQNSDNNKCSKEWEALEFSFIVGTKNGTILEDSLAIT